MTHILKDDSGTVTGVRGRSSADEPETFTADLVVGADGRFSFVAREFGAVGVGELNDFTSAGYMAEWDNVDDYSADWPNAITTYNTARRFMILMIPIAERKYLIATVMPSEDAHFGAHGAEQAYAEALQRVPHLQNRLKNAQQVSAMVGIRPIENGYREPFGVQWALVGDAVHYKDPSDGQGIYDALLGSKLLAESILAWKRGDLSWAEAGARYRQRLLDETQLMFRQTVANLKQSLFMTPPAFAIQTFARYLISDSDYQRQFFRYLSRAISPADYKLGPPLLLKAISRGVIGDLRGGRNG